MHTERALSCYTRNTFMLTNLACPISRLTGGRDYTTIQRLDYTIGKLGVVAQKAEKMLLKLIKE